MVPEHERGAFQSEIPYILPGNPEKNPEILVKFLEIRNPWKSPGDPKNPLNLSNSLYFEIFHNTTMLVLEVCYKIAQIMFQADTV